MLQGNFIKRDFSITSADPQEYTAQSNKPGTQPERKQENSRLSLSYKFVNSFTLKRYGFSKPNATLFVKMKDFESFSARPNISKTTKTPQIA